MSLIFAHAPRSSEPCDHQGSLTLPDSQGTRICARCGTSVSAQAERAPKEAPRRAGSRPRA